MSRVDQGDTLGVLLAAGALKELLDKNPDPAALNAKLDEGERVSNLAKLRAVLTQLDVIDDAKRPNPAAASVAEKVLRSVAKPQAFVDVLARILGSNPKTIANLAAGRLPEGTRVGKAEFAARTANVVERRKKLTDEDRRELLALPERLKELGLEDVSSAVRAFIDRYAAISGTEAVFEPRSVVTLYRDHGEHVLGYLQRPVRLAVLDADAPAEMTARFERFLDKLFPELDQHGMLPMTSVLGGMRQAGLSGALHRTAERFDAVERGGIMDGAGIYEAPAHIDRATIFGVRKGDAGALFADLSATAMLLAVDPGDADKKRVREHCLQGGVAIVLVAAKDPALDVPGVLQLAHDAPAAENAASAAEYLRARAESRKQQAFVSVAEHLAMSKAPAEINEIRQWARAESNSYRLTRLLNAALEKLSAAQPHASTEQISSWSFEFARNVMRFTHGIDNFAQNREWQAQAMKALASSGPEVAALAPELSMDVMFASWFGIREFNAAPSYFDQHTQRLVFPKELERLGAKGLKHTFNKDAYAEVRLDLITTKFLNAKDSAPEVFLGSREEMQLFYRANGYELDCTTHDTNGTEFHYFRSQDPSKPSVMVLHGVDSEARLLQIAALMKVNGVDPNRCVIRGEMSRVREVNRSLLEQRVMEVIAKGDVERKIAGVVIGNKNESIDALAAMAGVSPRDLKVEEHRAGPFRFRAIEVMPKGSDAPQIVLAFAPAYGQLSQDLVEAVASLGARNFVLGGAGGSLNANDKIDDVHQIIEAVYEGKRISFAETPSAGAVRPPNIELIPVQLPTSVATAINVFSPTPLEQDERWLGGARAQAKGAATANVDQETGCVFEGLRRAQLRASGLGLDGKSLTEGAKPGAGDTFHVQTTLVQSDVVGQGALAMSTVGSVYPERIKATMTSFFTRLGVGGVATSDGFAAIEAAQEGLLQAPRTKVARAGSKAVSGIVPKMDTMIAGWKSSAEQFKGEKVPFRIVAERFGKHEEQLLEKLLTTINPADVWIIVDASDPHNEKIRQSAKVHKGALAPKSKRIRDLAEKHGFETILMALDEEKPSIRGHFDFLLSYATDRTADGKGKVDVIERFMAHGNGDEDPNYSIPRTLVLGAAAPPAHAHQDPPLGMSEEQLRGFVDQLSLVHEELAGKEQDPKKKAEKLLGAHDEVMTLMTERWGGDRAAVDAVFAYVKARAARQGYHYTGGITGERIDRLVKNIRDNLDIAFDGGVQMFADGLTYRLPGLKPAITARMQALVKDGSLTPLPPRTGEARLDAPKFYPLDGLDEFFHVAGTDRMRRPIIWCGASRSSWPNIAPRSQYALHLFVELMAKLLADKKDELAHVTGGTRYGFEEIVHEVFAREGWHILSTLAQNTSVSADKWEPDDRIWHHTFTGINWYGVARPVAEQIALRYGGTIINVAGGPIAADQIALHLALNADAWQMTGLEPSEAGVEALRKKLQAKADKAAGGQAAPVELSEQQKRWVAGASVEMGEKYPARAFDTLDKLCEHMGAGELLAEMKRKAGIEGPLAVHDVEPLAASLGIDTQAIKARYPR